MSNMADTSLHARRNVNITLGQQQIIDFMRARPQLKPTRQDIADLTRMKLQTVCARVNELLYDFDPPIVRQLPAIDGKHPLELSTGQRPGPSAARSSSLEDAKQPDVAPPIESKIVAANGKIKRLVFIAPSCFANSHPSLSIASAKRIINDKSNPYYAEAERVLRSGEYTVYS